MYNQYFGLTSAPFRITPDTRLFFGGGQRAEILETLKYAINSGEGIIKVTGEVGTGKTMLCRMLQDQLPSSVEVVYLANPSLGRDETLSAICAELRLPVPENSSHLDHQRILQEHLLNAHQQGKRVVIFIEEAQQMPIDTLEEIRLLSNLETRDSKLLQLVLFGQSELNELLEKYEIRQLRDRITHSFNLNPLTTKEVREYLRFRLQGVGNKGSELFTDSALWLLAFMSRGLIRRIHVLADKAMLAAYANGDRKIGWRAVKRAVADTKIRSTHQRWLPPGLTSGLATGLAIAAIGSQLIKESPTPEKLQNSTPPLLSQQEIDGPDKELQAIRKRILQIKPAAGMPLVSERLRASKRLLSDPDRKGLTIQLMLTENDDVRTIENLFKKQPYSELLDQLYMYRNSVGGRIRWNILYGNFSSRAKALGSLAELPVEVQSHRPYLRSLANLPDTQKNMDLADKEENG